jgi:hypothetical protein
MEKIQQLLNLKNSDGTVITLFDGKITLSQLIIMIVAIMAVGIVLKLLKGVIKIVLSVGIACVLLVQADIVSPTQLKDVSSQIANAGVETYKTVAAKSSNIKIKDSTIMLNLNDKWIDIKDIDSVIQSGKNKLTIIVDGMSYLTDDSEVVNLVKSFL